MSIQKRKIAYYSIEFNCGDERSFDPNLFCEFLSYADSISGEERIFNDATTKKAVDFDSIHREEKEGLVLYKVTFKSCKYQHSPDYMSSVDGSERPSDKRLEEGEKELTHMCISIKPNEAYTIFEQRRNGVSIGGVIKYFNKLFKEFLRLNGIEENLYLFASLIPPQDFLTLLNNSERIVQANIYTEKCVLGSGYLDLMSIDPSLQDDLVITARAKRGESLSKRAMREAFLKVSTEGTTTSRIRIYAKDIDKLDVIIDSMGQKKIDEITVELNENGTVNSYSIFSRIEELMGVTE